MGLGIAITWGSPDKRPKSLAESVLNLQRALADFNEHYEALVANPEWLIGQRWSEPPKDAA